MKVIKTCSYKMLPSQAAKAVIDNDSPQEAAPAISINEENPYEPIEKSADEDSPRHNGASEYLKIIDNYFDCYSTGQGVLPLFLEKGQSLCELGLSSKECSAWQTISRDSNLKSGVYCSDCVEFMKSNMRNDTVDLTVTSPPYDSLRTYHGYEFDFEATARELFRVTKNGGVLVWVVGDAVVNGSETGTAFGQAQYFMKIGFRLHDTMIYQKTGVSYPSHGRYTQAFEYMFIFSKGKPKTFNPISDVPKRWSGSWGKLSTRNRNGSLKRRNLQNEGKGSSGRAEDGRYGYKLRNNVWVIRNGHGFGTRDDIAYKHPATFPEKLANDHIITWSNPGDLILDPLCGSGTTPKMAKVNGRQFVGIDISEEYCAIARKRIEMVESSQGGITVA